MSSSVNDRVYWLRLSNLSGRYLILDCYRISSPVKWWIMLIHQFIWKYEKYNMQFTTTNIITISSSRKPRLVFLVPEKNRKNQFISFDHAFVIFSFCHICQSTTDKCFKTFKSRTNSISWKPQFYWDVLVVLFSQSFIPKPKTIEITSIPGATYRYFMQMDSKQLNWALLLKF